MTDRRFLYGIAEAWGEAYGQTLLFPMAYLSPLNLTAYVITAFLAYWAWHDQQHRLGLKKHPFFSSGGQRPQRRRAPAQAVQVSSQGPLTQAQVMEAVRRVTVYTHDRDTAHRLLQATWYTHRGQPLDWCTEKTIEDIVRDRR